MGYQVQDNDGQNKVKVNAGTHHDSGQPQTDFIISETGYPNDHRHLVFDVNGNQVYDGYNPNRRGRRPLTLGVSLQLTTPSSPEHDSFSLLSDKI